MGRVTSLAGPLASTLVLLLMTACTAAPQSTSWSFAGATSRVEPSSTAAVGSGAVSAVSCSGATCSVTLGGDGARAHVLGTTIAFRGIAGDRANLRVADRDITLAPSNEVTVGSLRLACTAVTRDTVSLTATRS